MKKLLFLIIAIILTTSLVNAYDVYSASEHIKSIWYGTGVHINPRTGEKEVETYRDYKERNQKVPYDQYFCLVIPNKTYGYVVHKNYYGRVGYVYQTDNYSFYERQKCVPNVDSYPVIYSMNEIK